MKPFGIKALFLATAVAVTVSRRAIKRKSLSQSGAIAACVVGFLSVATGLRGLILLYFYQIGSMATKHKHNIKERIDASAAESSIRGPYQVLSCSIIAVVLSLVHAWRCGQDQAIDFANAPLSSSLACGVVAHYATCLGDTLASELGILAKQRPVLITKPWYEVPPGTNGGVTLRGCFWSAAGGAIMGMLTIVMDIMTGVSPLHMFTMIFFGAVCGLIGSFIDSVLGATLQVTYWDPDTKLVYQQLPAWAVSTQHISGVDLLNNVQVNFISVAVTTFIGGWILAPLMFR